MRDKEKEQLKKINDFKENEESKDIMEDKYLIMRKKYSQIQESFRQLELRLTES